MRNLDDNKYSDTNSKKATVAIVKSIDYKYAYVYDAIKKSIDLIGGLNSIIKPGNKVFVKVNHLSPPSQAEKGIVTHPIFVEAVLRLLNEHALDITVGDDLSFNKMDGFSISGLRQVCEREGVRLVNLREGGFVQHKCYGNCLDTVYLSKIVLNADIVVNLPKFKTHSLTYFTGGVKNMYGVIPGSLRSKYHGEYPNYKDFAQIIVDVYSAIIPNLTIMDAIIAMQGEGPASGTLKKLGIILTSQDSVALDTVATSLVGFNPKQVLTTQFCSNRRLGVGELDRIDIVGEKIADVSVSDFKAPISFTNLFIGAVPNALPRIVMDQLVISPQVIKRYCTGCRECENICPTNAIKVTNKYATINKEICIKCMCCHEVCLFHAIKPRRSLIGALIHLGSIIINALRSCFAR